MFDSWIWKMAWRDSRGSRKKLLLFLLSIVLGVAALVAINSFGDNLRRTVDEEARTLLGADLSLESNRAFRPEIEALIDSIGGRQSRRISFSSMALFTQTEDTRLVTVRAVEGDYPYYGEVETEPAGAAKTYLQDKEALVDGTLMEQFGAQVGDSIRIGRESYQIAGKLLKTPRESSAVMLFSPRVYIPLAHLDQELLALGSRAEYEVYFKLDEQTDVEALVEQIKPRLQAAHLGFDTVDEIKENWNEGLTNLYRFLSLVGFVALLLGGVGVASAVHVYVKQRVETVAVLRCLGAKTWRTIRVYLAQAFVMGLIGALAGSLLGIVVQLALPLVLADFLPVDVAFRVSWNSVLLGLGIGLCVTVLFALLPLVSVRRISPLKALRSSYEPEGSGKWDIWQWVILFLVIAGVLGFALAQSPEWQFGVGYAAGVAVVFALLALVAKGIMFSARKFAPTRWSYPWRQGLANLYRPHNQTLILMLALGLGAFFILTLYLVQRTLIAQVQLAGGEGQPNLVFYDIQTDQLAEVADLVREQGFPVLDQVPVVTMRLSSVKGQKIDEMRADTTAELTWAYTREYRSTYRDSLTESEKIVAGAFTGVMPDTAGAIPISLERDIAGDLSVGLGDTLVFNVQSVPMTTVVTSLRQVDWRRLSTNFFVVFPAGALEDAPQFHVLLTHTATDEVSARLQSTMVRAFPNVSAIDLSLVLNVFKSIFSRVSFVVRFMALFSILTGLIVLIGAVVVSRYQRVGESVLLKTLGASRAVVFKIMLIEYFFLGLFATLTGLLLALAGSWALARFVFEAPFVIAVGPMLLAVILITSVTVAVGFLNSRGIYDRPALEVLRAEV